MADVFISYAREDRSIAQAMAQALAAAGCSVWWDREMLPGDAFADVITTELGAARSVIVIWSKASLASPWVRDEAGEGLERRVLVPVVIDAVEPPMGFRSVHAANLSAWQGDETDPEWRDVVDAIASLRGERPAAPPPHEPPFLRGWWRRLRKALVSRRMAWAAGLAFALGFGWLVLRELPALTSDTPRAPLPSEIPPPQNLPAFRDCPACPEMVEIPAGRFHMGASWLDFESQSDERPRVAVAIGRPFAIARHEVTFEQWQACVTAGGCNGYVPDDMGWGKERRPVVFVSWDDVAGYLAWLREETGKDYRLPSEAEWEYACHAGAATRYPFGDAISAALANYDRNVASTREVGVYPANPWGLHDMNGNVWEWVEDVYDDDHGDNPRDGSARRGGPDAQDRVVRGGSWDDRARRVRCISRNGKDRDQRENEIGFRVALSR